MHLKWAKQASLHVLRWMRKFPGNFRNIELSKNKSSEHSFGQETDIPHLKCESKANACNLSAHFQIHS